MQVIIIGGGKAGRYLAEKLKDEHEVTIIEQRLDTVEELKTLVAEARIIHGDACEPSVLEHAGLAHADLIAALTGDDEDNLVAAFLAKCEFGVPLVFARINHPSNEWLFTKEWGVDVAVSAASLIVDLIEKEISLGDIVTLLQLQSENLAIEEISLPETSTAVGKRMFELEMPEDTRVVAIVRGGGVVVPNRKTMLAAGDRLLLLAALNRKDELHATLGLRGAST